MDFESLPDQATRIEIGLQELNLIVALITSVAALYVAIIMFWWWWRLRYVESNFRSFIFDVGIAKIALWSWSFTGIIQIVVFDVNQPIVTLPARLLWLLVVIRQALTTLKYYKHDDNYADPPGPFQV